MQWHVAGLATEGDLVVSDRDAGVLAGVVARQVLTVDLRAVLVDDEAVGDVVDVLRRHTGFDVWGQLLQHACGDSAGDPQHRNLRCTFNGNRIVVDVMSHDTSLEGRYEFAAGPEYLGLSSVRQRPAKQASQRHCSKTNETISIRV